MQHINPNGAGAYLYDMRIDFHSIITIKRGKQRYGVGFKVDRLTDATRDALTQRFSNVEFMRTQSQYAREIQSALIVFKTMAQMKRDTE